MSVHKIKTKTCIKLVVIILSLLKVQMTKEMRIRGTFGLQVVFLYRVSFARILLWLSSIFIACFSVCKQTTAQAAPVDVSGYWRPFQI